jgi:Cytochrome C oxidase, cbb3-type, subunit III
VLLVAAIVGWSVTPTRSFTTEQATAGRAAYEQQCASCHGANLRQLPEALLAGREFTAKWDSRPASELIAYMRSAMPPTTAGRLPESTYVDIAAYLLQVNGGIADGRALAANSAVRVGDGLGAGCAGDGASQRRSTRRAHRRDGCGHGAELRAGDRPDAARSKTGGLAHAAA